VSGAFYKALGFAVWKFALAYVRQQYGRRIRIALILGAASLAAAGYLAARSSDDQG
jgi:hypothetical protein